MPFQDLKFFNSDGEFSDVVDIFDGNTGKWHTAQLSVPRIGTSATSLPSQGLVLFAGGRSTFLFD